MTAKRSAEYTKAIPTRHVWTLVTMMNDNDMTLSSSQIRSKLRGCLSNTMNVSKQMDNLLGAFNNTEARMIYDGTVRETYQDGTVIRRSQFSFSK